MHLKRKEEYMASARKRERRTAGYQCIRRVRKAKQKCGCETLREFLLLAKQVRGVPEEIDIGAEVKNIRRHKVSDSILVFVDDVYNRPDGFFRTLWSATQTSGRVAA